MNWPKLRRTKRQKPATTRLHPIKTWLAALCLFVISLLLGLLFSFPTSLLGQRLLQGVESRAQVKIETGDFSLSPLFTLHGTNTIVRSTSSAWPPVSIESFALSPLWLSVFSANPGGHLEGQLLNGQVLADFYRDGSLSVEANNLSLDFPLLEHSDNLQLTGRLVNAQLHGALPLQKSTENSLKMVFENIELAGLTSGPRNLRLGTIALEATGRGNSFKISTLKATGGDFTLEGRGTFLAGRTLPSSRLSIRAEIRPAQGADPNLVELLDLVAPARADGSHQLNLSGTLANPILK